MASLPSILRALVKSVRRCQRRKMSSIFSVRRTNVILSNVDTLNPSCESDINSVIDEEGYACGLRDLV